MSRFMEEVCECNVALGKPTICDLQARKIYGQAFIYFSFAYVYSTPYYERDLGVWLSGLKCFSCRKVQKKCFVTAHKNFCVR